MTETFNIDPAHTTIGFTAKHMMVTTVRGRFADFSGTVELPDGDASKATASVVIQAASIDTGQQMRDDHLRSADFFDSANHPELTYRSTSISPLGGERYRVVGDLTIRGATRPVTLEVEVGERFQDPWGNQRVGVSAVGKINRKDWDLNWNQVLEAGRLLVSEEIKLEIDAAFVRKLEQSEVAA